MESKTGKNTDRKGHGALWVLVLLAGLTAIPASATDNAGAKAIFRKRCTGCHTYGKGVKVGPDLKGVTERRQKPWLLNFIQASSKVIQSGDRTATALYSEFKQERMPDWTDLSRQQIESLIDYFEAGGPSQKEPDERQAITATESEVEMGRRLFQGTARIASGRQACIMCHGIRDAEGARGGSLGPDLTRTYFKYQDKALTDFLKQPSHLHAAQSPASPFLTPQESFDLKAYMAKAAGLAIPALAPSRPADRMIATAVKATKGGFR